MRRGTIAPTGQERTFPNTDIIVSKTDLQGRITYANDVFLDIARYKRSEVIGQPHSLLRHPDMPGGVFHLMWETISSGKEIFAYINNLASDGAHYWVLAHVTPTVDKSGKIIGYHSNRRSPDRHQIEQIKPIYERMRAEEAKHSNKREAAAASAAMLAAELEEAVQTYEQFIWGIISGDRTVAA